MPRRAVVLVCTATIVMGCLAAGPAVAGQAGKAGAAPVVSPDVQC